jgi:hypothetical protein
MFMKYVLPKSVDLAIFATWAVICATIVSTVTLTPGILVLMMAPMLFVAMVLGALRNGKLDSAPGKAVAPVAVTVEQAA